MTVGWNLETLTTVTAVQIGGGLGQGQSWCLSVSFDQFSGMEPVWIKGIKMTVKKSQSV